MTVTNSFKGKNANNVIFDGTEHQWPNIRQTRLTL